MPAKSVLSASDELSPPGVQERGSLRTSEGRSQFIGSASGVYFVNTVRSAFANAGLRHSSLLSDHSSTLPEDCIVPDDDDGSERRRSGEASAVPSSRALSPQPAARGAAHYGRGIPPELGRPPPAEVAGELFITYFQTWHRFFPFLHGPTVNKDMETLYSANDQQPAGSSTKQQAPARQRLPLARIIILQCLFNLAALHGGVELPAASRIDRPAGVLPCLIEVAAKGDMVSMQALFAVQLLLVARMSLRTAVVVAGLLSRTIFLAGLHRCPVRYGEFSADDCDIRKRLFWSIYVVDRFLSQALGHPLGIQDSDVDVCSVAGPELHQRPFDCQNTSPGSTTATTASQGKASQDRPSATHEAHEPDSSADQSHVRNRILACQVEYSRLLGRTVELFHKSIHIRSIDPGTVLSLRTDLNAWWNSLPSSLQELDLSVEETTLQASRGEPFNAAAFFTLLHSQLRLLINRPWLSLEPSAPEFQSALQICIGASRDIILSTRKLRNARFALFWPGYLSAVWMAGVIIAFACHLHLHPAEKGQWYDAEELI